MSPEKIRTDLLALHRQFLAASADNSRAHLWAKDAVIQKADLETGQVTLMEGSYRYYPLRLQAVCIGNGLNAKFDCYLPGQAFPVLINIPCENLQKEITPLQVFEESEYIAAWNIIQLRAAKMLSELVPATGRHGVPGDLVKAFFAPHGSFSRELFAWKTPQLA